MMAKLSAAAQLNVPEAQLCSFERDAGVYQAKRSDPIANIALNLQITKNLKTSDVSSSGRECNLAFEWDYNRMIHGGFCNPTCVLASLSP